MQEEDANKDECKEGERERERERERKKRWAKHFNVDFEATGQVKQ